MARRTCGKSRVSIQGHLEICRFSYHGILAHQDNTLATEGESNLVHLLGADIVDGDDEDGGVLFEQALE
jgi:hypothetical protein